jgi:hypothetical protein
MYPHTMVLPSSYEGVGHMDTLGCLAARGDGRMAGASGLWLPTTSD